MLKMQKIANNSKIATNQQIVPHIFYLTPAACDRRYVCNFLASCMAVCTSTVGSRLE